MKPKWLLIIFDVKIELQLVFDLGPRIEGCPMIAPFGGGSIGHYDWLRSQEGKIGGVRFWSFEDECHATAIEAFFQEIKNFDYVGLSPDGKYIKFNFFRGFVFNENLSNDQDLGDNGIFRLPNEKYAMYFEVNLAENEITALEQSIKEKK